MVWTGIIGLAGLTPSDDHSAASIDASARAVWDTPRLSEAIQELVADDDRRRLLHAGINPSVSRSNDLLGRWAAVMLNADAYARLIDRHVELAGDVACHGVQPTTRPVRADRRGPRTAANEPEQPRSPDRRRVR
jgi:hypothetical protein